MRNAHKSLLLICLSLLIGCGEVIEVETNYLEREKRSIPADETYSHTVDLLPFKSKVSVIVAIDKGFPPDNSYSWGLYTKDQWMSEKKHGDSNHFYEVMDADQFSEKEHEVTIPAPSVLGAKKNTVVLGVRCKSKSPVGMSMPCELVITLQASAEIPQVPKR